MSTPRFTAPVEWRLPPADQVAALCAELQRVAESDSAPNAFYGALLNAMSESLGVPLTEHWSPDADGRPRPAGFVRHASAPPVVQLDSEDTAEVFGVYQSATPSIWHAPQGTRIARPVHGLSGPSGVLLVVMPTTASPEAVLSADEFLDAIVEIADRYELRREAKRLRTHQRAITTDEAFLHKLLEQRSSTDVATVSAEQLDHLLPGGRVTVFVKDNNRWRVGAVSGVRRISRRSDAVRRLEELARSTLLIGQGARFDNGKCAVTAAAGKHHARADEANAPDQVESAVAAYADAAHATAFWIAPCIASDDDDSPVLALLIERFDSELEPDLAERVAPTARRAASVARRDSHSVLRMVASLAWSRRLWVVMIVILAATATLFGVRGDLEVAAEGRLVPTEHVRLFAPRNAIVEQVLVAHGDSVQTGEPLLRLASAELQIEREQLAEAIALTRQELSSLRTEQLRSRHADPRRSEEKGALASREAALVEQLSHQQRRAELLAKESDRLVVVSPIDGQVLSWRPADYLSARTVQRGQRLLEIAQPNGAWRLQIDLPDAKVGRVLAAQEIAGEPLPIRYVVKASPDTEHAATVLRIASSTTLDASGSPVVRIEAAPTGLEAPAVRSGSVVAAKIDCGAHRLATVWFHEVWDTVRRAWF